jgi:putative FmdB family regulatory protein
MPIYEYRCENGHIFEVIQKRTDDPVAVCQTCEAPVQRVFHPVAVHFKGSGFYSTDYGKKKSSDASTDTKPTKTDSSSNGSSSSDD